MIFYCYLNIELEEIEKIENVVCSYNFINSIRNNKWNIYEIQAKDENIFELTNYLEKVPEYLYSMLYSTKKYPPALALACSKLVEYEDSLLSFSRDEISLIFAKIINYFLDNQIKYPFFLSKPSINSSRIELLQDNYYWLVGYNSRKKIIYWVNEQFYIYEDSKESFLVNNNNLKNLEGYPRNILIENISLNL